MKIWVLVAIDHDYGYAVKLFHDRETAEKSAKNFRRVGWTSVFVTQEELSKGD